MSGMSDCVFCKIIAGEIPARFAYRDDEVIAIVDVNPQAPQHLLVMPVRHAADIVEFTASATPDAVAKLMRIAAELGREQQASGFRAVINTGPDGGQTVGHLHVHVLAGRAMGWPPG